MQVDIDLKTVIIILFILYGIYQDKIHAFFRVLDRFMEMGDVMMNPMSLHHSQSSMFHVNTPTNAMVPYQTHTLVSQNNVLYLYSSNVPLIPGVNPIIFTTYSDYAQYVAYKNQYGANMKLLPITNVNNTTKLNTMGESVDSHSHSQKRESKPTPAKRTYYSDSAMDPNWGGRSYSMSNVNQGAYI